MLIVAVAAYLVDPFGNKRYFHLIQTPIQEALTSDGIEDVEQRGLSDLAIHGRKILGSSLRRQRQLLVYQAVLLVDAARDLFARYLQHPPREPDYRAGREHRDFTTNLRERGLQVSLQTLQERLQTHLDQRLPVLLEADLVATTVR
jgi:lipoate-protein ligase A